MSTRKPLFNKPAWAAESNVAVDAETLFQRNKMEEFQMAERKYAAEKKAKEERRAKRKEEKEEARNRSQSQKTKVDEDDQTVKKRRVSTDSLVEVLGESVEKTTVLKKNRHLRKSEARSSPPIESSTETSPQRSVKSNTTKDNASARDSEDDLAIVDVQPRKDSSTTKAAVAEPSDSESDLEIRKLKKKTREERARKARDSTGLEENEPVVTVRVKSIIPKCEAMQFEVKPSQKMDKLLIEYLQRQEIIDKFRKEVYFLWQGEQQYGSTTVKTLMMLAERQSTPKYGQKKPVTHIELEAVNAKVHEHRKQQKLREKNGDSSAAEPAPNEVNDQVEPEQVKGIVIELKTGPNSGLPDMTLRVRADTSILKIVRGYKRKNGLDMEMPVYLNFDGDNLEESQTVAELDLDDGDCLDVLVRK